MIYNWKISIVNIYIMHTVGSRAEVWHGNAEHTSGGLAKKDLLQNKWGRIVSAKKHKTAKKEKRLEKAGFFAKKGKFGAVKRATKKSRKMRKSRKMMKGGEGEEMMPAAVEMAPEMAPAMAPEEEPAAVL
jgi:hypothetical protein